MTLRLIIKTDEARVPGCVQTSFQTIDVHLPKLESLMTDGGYNEDGTFLIRYLAGIEVLRPAVSAPPEPK